MYEIKNKIYLKDDIIKMDIYHQDIPRNYKPGQFVILRVDENGERIPLTIYDVCLEKSLVSVIFLVVGVSTYKLSKLNVGDKILDLTGPLGKETEILNYKKILVIGGGTGSAICYPLCKTAFNNNIHVDCLLGYKNKEYVILEKEFLNVTNNLNIYTDDGSYGMKGYVTTDLKYILTNDYDCVFAIGPLIMMKNVCLITKEVKTIVSMNPIMIDGTGMCGCCRLKVDGVIKFACVDGPDFDGSKVDFDEMILRNNAYLEEEKKCYDCNLLKTKL